MSTARSFTLLVRSNGNKRRGAMVSPKIPKSKVVHISTYKGRRSPQEKRKRKLKPQWGFNSKRPTSATQKIKSATVLDMQRHYCKCCFSIFPLHRLGPLRAPSSIFLRFEFQFCITWPLHQCSKHVPTH